MFERQPAGLDHLQMRAVIMGIGKPVAHRGQWVTPRLVGLIVLLGLVILLGLVGGGAAWGETGTVKKGSGGAQGIGITPLEKLKIERAAASTQLFNFLQNFSVLRATAPAPTLPLSPESPKTATNLLVLLIAALTLMLWLHLRAGGPR